MTAEIGLTSLYPPRPCTTRSHMRTSPSPRQRSSRSHALRYFGFLNVWPGLQFPDVWPLELDLLYVYQRNPVYVRSFRSFGFSVQSLITPTPIYIYSLYLSLYSYNKQHTVWVVLDTPVQVSVFSLSLYRHPYIYTLFSSHFTLIINNNKELFS